jgi:hypothetical protein
VKLSLSIGKIVENKHIMLNKIDIKKIRHFWTSGVAQVIECLPSKWKVEFKPWCHQKTRKRKKGSLKK